MCVGVLRFGRSPPFLVSPMQLEFPPLFLSGSGLERYLHTFRGPEAGEGLPVLIILSVTFGKCLNPLDCVPLTVVFCQFGSVSKGWGAGRVGAKAKGDAEYAGSPYAAYGLGRQCPLPPAYLAHTPVGQCPPPLSAGCQSQEAGHGPQSGLQSFH